MFLVECAVGGAAGRFVVPPASAQQVAAGLQRWEYTCFTDAGQDVIIKANALGAEGWELAVGLTTGAGKIGERELWCFRRLLR